MTKLSDYQPPGKHEGYLTESESATAPNFVEVKRGGCCVCPCRAYQVSSVCSHALAVADIAGCLEEYLVWYHTKSGGANLTATASITAPKNSGMKPGQSRRQRPSRKRCSERDKEEYSERRPYTQCSDDGQLFSLKWLSTSTARVCYGCGGHLRSSISTVPDAPFDVVLTTKEYRSWFDKNANIIKITKFQNPLTTTLIQCVFARGIPLLGRQSICRSAPIIEKSFSPITSTF